MEVTQVGGRTAERGQARTQEHPEYFQERRSVVHTASLMTGLILPVPLPVLASATILFYE
jgi:hypothetical protein